MHRQTKATAIPPAVKKAVWERDCGCCVICGSSNAGPHCHIVRRSHGGLGIEQNIFTGCHLCHEEFDSEGRDGPLHKMMREYMKGWYPGWDEADLIFKKYGGNNYAEQSEFNGTIDQESGVETHPERESRCVLLHRR